MRECDFLVVGAGIAGTSCANWLAREHSVIVLEMEGQPGYHTTGRSIAVYTEVYGPRTIRALAKSGHEFFVSPPAGHSEVPLSRKQDLLFVAREDQRSSLEAALAAVHELSPDIREISQADAIARVPVLRRDYLAAALLDPTALALDVAAIHQGYIRGLTRHGGEIVCDAEAIAFERKGGKWQLSTRAGDFAAPVVVDAAGAWADEIAVLAGVAPVGLVPKRRTAFTFDPPEAVDPGAWPMAVDIDEQFYFKPEAGQILGSPADETPMPPCDVQPDELDIAIAVDRIQRAASFDIRRINHRWAGLRSFVADHLPVVGYAAGVEGFFWLAGQGGIGIMTAPAVSRFAAAQVLGREPPADLAERGIGAAALSPSRVRGALP